MRDTTAILPTSVHNIDTRNAAPVAPSFLMAEPTDMYPTNLGEQLIIETIRELLAADRSPDGFATADAWNVLKSEVGGYLEGDSLADRDLGDPLLENAIESVAAYILSRRAKAALRIADRS